MGWALKQKSGLFQVAFPLCLLTLWVTIRWVNVAKQSGRHSSSGAAEDSLEDRRGKRIPIS